LWRKWANANLLGFLSIKMLKIEINSGLSPIILFNATPNKYAEGSFGNYSYRYAGHGVIAYTYDASSNYVYNNAVNSATWSLLFPRSCNCDDKKRGQTGGLIPGY
jgi:hypothetical protein